MNKSIALFAAAALACAATFAQETPAAPAEQTPAEAHAHVTTKVEALRRNDGTHVPATIADVEIASAKGAKAATWQEMAGRVKDLIKKDTGIGGFLKKDAPDHITKGYYDWNGSAQDAPFTANYRSTLNNVRNYLTEYPYAVVLMHETQLFSVNAVPEIIRYALSKGYEFRALDPSCPVVHHPMLN